MPFEIKSGKSIHTDKYWNSLSKVEKSILLYAGDQEQKEPRNHNNQPEKIAMSNLSIITCPECGFSQEEVMISNACEIRYQCTKCKAVLAPIEGECCVFCSYGSADCPAKQKGQKCCS